MSAIEGFVPKEVVQTLHTFLDFYYLVCQNVLDEDDLEAIEDALERFYAAWAIFQEVGVQPTRFSLPRQHAMKHYICHILKFGAPNSLCSSITESTHITAVKKPWQWSSRNNPMEQILIVTTLPFWPCSDDVFGPLLSSFCTKFTRNSSHSARNNKNII